MAITFALVEVTPHKLRYLATAAASTNSFDTGVIPNAAGVTPDLRTDASTFEQSALDKLVSTAAANQAAARALLNGDLLDTVGELPTERAHLSVMPRDAIAAGESSWTVDANEGAAAGAAPSAGFAVIVVNGPSGANTAYITLQFDHTIRR
jgi:hypothetical protein